MEARGSIIVTSSGAGLKTFQNLSSYNASKFGVIGLARTLANELATQAHPRQRDRSWDGRDTDGDGQRGAVSAVPPRQPWVEPEDISNVLVFLASDNARYITGTVFPVDQGSNNKA